MSTSTIEATSAPDLTALYTPGQCDVLAQLNALKTQLGLSDAEFVRRYITISSTVWSRVNSGTYPAGVASVFVKLEGNLRQLRIQLAKNAKLTGSVAFHVFTQQQAASDAVTTCKMKPVDDPNRFVAYLAPTGGGKTALARQLKVEHDGILVEGRESWRTSYNAALVTIGTAAGVPESELVKGVRFAETALLKRLNSNRRVLIIDEGEYFGPRTINLVKLILNQTPTVVIVLAIPELFDRWQKAAWEEARQINRRAEAIVELELVTPEEVATFLATRVTLASDAKQVAGVIAKAANEFGHYDLVTRVVQQLATDSEGERVTLEDAQQAIRCVRRLLNRTAA